MNLHFCHNFSVKFIHSSIILRKFNLTKWIETTEFFEVLKVKSHLDIVCYLLIWKFHQKLRENLKHLYR